MIANEFFYFNLTVLYHSNCNYYTDNNKILYYSQVNTSGLPLSYQSLLFGYSII